MKKRFFDEQVIGILHEAEEGGGSGTLTCHYQVPYFSLFKTLNLYEVAKTLEFDWLSSDLAA